MAEFDPDAYLAPPAAPAAAGGFDPDAYLAGAPAAAPSLMDRGRALLPKMSDLVLNGMPGGPQTFTESLANIPHEMYAAGASALHDINAVNPWGEERTAARARGEAPGAGDVPRAVMGALQLPAAPLMGATRSVGGYLLNLLNQGMRGVAVKMYGEDKVRRAEAENGLPVGGGSYETAKSDVDQLMAGLGPRGGLRPVAVPLPPPPVPGALGVTLSEGQRTGDLALIRREQAALRGQLGPSAATQATEFAGQQGAQVAQAGEDVARGLDPFGMRVAETPADAGAVVSQGVRSAAASAKAGVDALYGQARGLPGEIDADVFRGMGSRIRDDLTNRAEPVIIDDQLTPYAARAIRDIDNRVAQLQIQNRASPAGQPPQNQIVGVTLDGVDQMRKRLSAMRQSAFGSGNATDGRAVRAVLDAFDDAVDHAVNNGAFTGDTRAVQAWNDARTAHADYRSTFGGGGGNDPVGRVVGRILGRNNTPAAIPNDVADFLYGASGTNPNTLNVAVANRVRSILGEQSPEWSAVKQGLFARLTETVPGMTDYGSGQIAQRLNRFLNGDGRELAAAMFSPAERRLLQEYADLHRKLQVPKTGANWSETSTFLAPILRRIGSKVGMVVGGLTGGAIGHSMGIPFAGEIAGAGIAKGAAAVGNAMDARQIARQMPLIAQSMQRYQRARAAAQRANTPLSARTLAIGTTNLGNALAPLGIDLRKLAGTGSVPAQAEQNQRQRGGGVDEEDDGGDGSGLKRAAGGRVEAANIDHAPTEAQKEAGNYAKDHIRIHGLDITIENAKGAERRGVGRDGKPWSVKMPAHYGYIKGTVGRDKDHVDVYVGPHRKSPHVFVVDQMDAESGRFDEHKTLLGFSSREQARRAYVAGFSDGKGYLRLGHMEEMPIAVFKRWLTDGDTTQRAQGAADGHKLSHKAVGYVARSRHKDRHCSVCSMFRAGPACTLVRDIVAGGWCRRFEPK